MYPPWFNVRAFNYRGRPRSDQGDWWATKRQGPPLGELSCLHTLIPVWSNAIQNTCQVPPSTHIRRPAASITRWTALTCICYPFRRHVAKSQNSKVVNVTVNHNSTLGLYLVFNISCVARGYPSILLFCLRGKLWIKVVVEPDAVFVLVSSQ